jgi:hypothetical protein
MFVSRSMVETAPDGRNAHRPHGASVKTPRPLVDTDWWRGVTSAGAAGKEGR